MATRAPGRALTFAAAGFLFLDALLLLLAGVWSGRWGLLVWAGVFILGGFGVIRLWRRYVAAVAELDAARHALRVEALQLRETLKSTRG